MLLGLVMLTNRMVVSRLVVVMSGRTVVSGGIVMVFGGGCLLFSAMIVLLVGIEVGHAYPVGSQHVLPLPLLTSASLAP